MPSVIADRLIAVNKGIIRFERILLPSLLLIIIFLAFGQVVLRNLFSLGYVWIDDILKICLQWIAFTGASLAMEYNGHIKIDLLTHVIKSKQPKKIIETTALISTFLICGLLFCASIEYIGMVSSVTSRSAIPGIPGWILKSIIPYCFAVMGFRCMIHMLPANKQKNAAEKE